MAQVLVSMFDDVSTRELSSRRLETQTTAFGLMLEQMEVPDGLSSEFEELEAELNRRDAIFNRHRVSAPIASLLEVLHLAIAEGTFQDIAARLALGFRRQDKHAKLNPNNPFFDEIEIAIGDDERVEFTTFHFRIDLTSAEVHALVPDLAETGSYGAFVTYSILRMTGNHCGRIDFVVQQSAKGTRLERVIVTRL